MPTVVVDSRERKPWSFPGHRHLYRKLPVGDYTFYGYSKLLAVERKSLSDFVSSLVDGRLVNQLGRLQRLPRAVVVVEGSIHSLAGHQHLRGILSVDGCLGELGRLTGQYGVPIVLAGRKLWARDLAMAWMVEAKTWVDESSTEEVDESVLHWSS